MENAAMLWTGGKDSALALYEARRNGLGVRCLVTFAPPAAAFLAHPISFMQLQAQAMGMPHVVLAVQEPFAQGYESALAKLRDEMGISTVVTGDIALVAGQPNWIRERSRPLGLTVETPLWGRDRLTLLQQLLGNGFQVLFSCVKRPWLTEDWAGRELDAAAIADLQKIRGQTGLDLCGEDGEYHTLVTDGPMFARRIVIRHTVRHTQDSLTYLEIGKAELVGKAKTAYES